MLDVLLRVVHSSVRLFCLDSSCCYQVLMINYTRLPHISWEFAVLEKFPRGFVDDSCTSAHVGYYMPAFEIPKFWQQIHVCTLFIVQFPVSDQLMTFVSCETGETKGTIRLLVPLYGNKSFFDVVASTCDVEVLPHRGR
jgi:hypothetical protein